MEKEIEKIKINLIIVIKKYIEIIRKEYKNLASISENINLEEYIHIENTGTISLFIRNGHFYFPIDAFIVLEKLSNISGFGSDKNHKTCSEDNIIINDNTYETFIEHVFLKGLTPQEYYEEVLLHETLHFCGSGGGGAIREGINELKTRELAKKYGLLTSSCGYPKEIKIAYELQNIFGEEIINKIAFSKNDLEIKKILSSVSKDAVKFYFTLEEIMEYEFYNKYMKYNFPGETGPIRKTQKYNMIDYTNAYLLIKNYKKSHNMSDISDSLNFKGKRYIKETK